MRALNTFANSKQIQKLIDEDRVKTTKHTTVQVCAVILWTLATSEGFGEKRLRRVMKEVTNMSEDMNGVGFVPPFTSKDCVEYLKEKYGIDLNAEINLEES